MRVPRFRFTVRGWMFVVAVFAAVIVLGIQITRLAKLRKTYLENVAGHAYAQQMDQEMLSELAEFRSEGSVDKEMMSVLSLTGEANHGIDPRLLSEKSTLGEKLDLIENHVRSSQKWHTDMKQKWQRAVDRPWEPVSDDSYYTYQNSMQSGS
jgi:hypothetical protein